MDAAELATLRTIRDSRFARGLECVHCASPRVQRWGCFSGRQRYRCNGCRRTFSDLTGTPLAYTKRLSHWPGFLACWQQSASVRRTAALISVHPTTAFRWRHLLCDALRSVERPGLRGWTEAIDLRFRYSEKGQARRGLRRRRGQREQRDRRRVSVVVLHDRLGSAAGTIMGWSRPHLPTLVERCGEWLGQSTLLLSSHRRFEPLAAAAVALGLPHVRVARSPSVDARMHLVNATSHATRLLEWLERFRGVATRYLDNYLAWHRHIEPLDSANAGARILARACHDADQQAARTECEGCERKGGGLRPRAPTPRADHPVRFVTSG